jgi:hypothetical protein
LAGIAATSFEVVKSMLHNYVKALHGVERAIGAKGQTAG